VVVTREWLASIIFLKFKFQIKIIEYLPRFIFSHRVSTVFISLKTVKLCTKLKDSKNKQSPITHGNEISRFHFCEI